METFCLSRKLQKTCACCPRVTLFRHSLFLILLMGMTTFLFPDNISAQGNKLVVRMAKLQIDPAQLEKYKAALKEEIETSVRVEQGVLTLYAVHEKNNPTHVTIFEIYADEEAYKSHIQTPHFKKYKDTTKEWVKSLELVDVVPVALEAKPKL